jgi:hypothetical protein
MLSARKVDRQQKQIIVEDCWDWEDEVGQCNDTAPALLVK